MKKKNVIISVITLAALLLVPMTASASKADPAIISSAQTLVSSEIIELVPDDLVDKKGEIKEFILETYNDNGVTVYSIDVEDMEYRQAAMEYINRLTGDNDHTADGYSKGVIFPGQSEYHNDTEYNGDAVSYAWKRNTVSTSLSNNFEGGQSSMWNGTGNCNFIVLNQGIDISGVSVSISWPPSVSGSGTSGSWQSSPIYSNLAGASFSGLTVSGWAFSCAFTESGDVYVGNHIYRPVTYIKFSYFS